MRIKKFAWLIIVISVLFPMRAVSAQNDCWDWEALSKAFLSLLSLPSGGGVERLFTGTSTAAYAVDVTASNMSSIKEAFALEGETVEEVVQGLVSRGGSRAYKNTVTGGQNWLNSVNFYQDDFGDNGCPPPPLVRLERPSLSSLQWEDLPVVALVSIGGFSLFVLVLLLLCRYRSKRRVLSTS